MPTELTTDPSKRSSTAFRIRALLISAILIVVITAILAVYLPSRAPRTLEYPDFRVVYAYPWQQSSPLDWMNACRIAEIWNCATAFTTASDEATGVLIGYYTLDDSSYTASLFEESTRTEWLELNPGMSFVRVEELTIGGLPAAARIVSGVPTADGSGEDNIYGMMIYVINDTTLYQLLVESQSESQFEADRAAIDQLLAGIAFR